ncbi:hypothetical protein E4U51_002306 [Claviceps purpurea]|nr:hypothetical protein E4U51_002306 [Claviceps purpurea]
MYCRLQDGSNVKGMVPLPLTWSLAYPLSALVPQVRWATNTVGENGCNEEGKQPEPPPLFPLPPLPHGGLGACDRCGANRTIALLATIAEAGIICPAHKTSILSRVQFASASST